MRPRPFFFLLKIYLFIYFFLCWVFVSVWGLSLVMASGGHSSWRCAGLSLSRPLLLRSTGSRRAGTVIVAHGPSCSTAYEISPDQGSNPCPLHWQADSQPLRHQGSPGHDHFCVGLFMHMCMDFCCIYTWEWNFWVMWYGNVKFQLIIPTCSLNDCNNTFTSRAQDCSLIHIPAKNQYCLLKKL